MEEQPNGAPTGAEDEQQGAPTGAPSSLPEVAQADVPEWFTQLQAADPKEVSKFLRKNNVVAGFYGSDVEARVNEALARREGELAREKARAEATAQREAKLTKARENPVEFADDFLSEQEERSNKLAEAQSKHDEMNRLADKIGQRLEQIPEWAEMPPEERHARLAKAFEGVAQEDVMAVFVTTTAELLAEAKANKHRTSTLAGERKALKTEVTAEMLANGQYPDLRAASGPGRIDWVRLSDADFDKAYTERYLK